VSPVSRGRKKKRPTAPPRARGWALPPSRPAPTLSRSSAPASRRALPPGARYAIDDLDPAQRLTHHTLTSRGWALDPLGGDWGPAWYYPPSVPADWDPEDPDWDEKRATPLTPTRLSEDRDGQPWIERAGPIRTGPLGELLSYPDLASVLAEADEIESWRASEPRPAPQWRQPPGGWPRWLWTVPYRAGPPRWDSSGADAQHYAYAILALFGHHLPALTPAQLWADTSHTERVTAAPEPLDLVLFNDSSDAQGAHLGVWMSSGQILHLCPEVGVPAVWTPETFRATTRYSKVVGAKRPSPSAVVSAS